MHHIRISNSDTKFRAAANGALRTQQPYYSRALFEANADAIVVTDTQGVITDVNQQMVEITGCGRSELIGANWFSFCPDAVNAGVAFGRALTEDRVSNIELVVKSCQGSETPVTYNATPIYDGQTNLVGVFATLRDTTEFMRMKRDLEAKGIEVERANQMKSDFLATMSHELRTPLTAILGFSEALLCGLLGEIGDEQKEYIQDIHASGQHLLELISDILDLAKINAGMMQLNMETADLRDVLTHSVLHTSRQPAAPRIKMEIDEGNGPFISQLDLRKTQKIIDHMLSNAVKFSSPEGNVRIHACRVPRSSVGKLNENGAEFGHPLPAGNCSEFIQLTVEDSGIGIAQDNLPKIYDLFTQIDSGLERRFEGVGLGISMIQRLAELHGGTTAIASVEGTGTSFAVWLPLNPIGLSATYVSGLPH